MATLFEKIGGAETIDAAVDNFYLKILKDDRISSFLIGADVKEQALRLKMFLTYAFGGLISCPGKSMRAAHQELVDHQGLGDEHFDAVVESLIDTLTELGLAKSLIEEVAVSIEKMRDDVLCR